MNDLSELLAQYQLSEPRRLATRFRRMGRLSLRSFLEDLVRYADERRGTRKGDEGLAIAAIGGTMGLGSADAVAQETALYADHLVLRNDIAGIASQLLEGVDDGNQKKFEANRDMALARLHPYIYQYLMLRPLWERGMASFVYPEDKPSAESVPDDLKNTLLTGTSLQVTGSGSPWFSVKTGGSQYTATPQMQIKGFELLSDRLWNSTRERDAVMGPRMLVANEQGETRPDDPEKLLDPSHALYTQFDEFARAEVAHLETSVEACLLSNSHFVTDDDLQWRLLSGMDPTAERGFGGRPAAMFDLASQLAFIRDIPLDRLLKLRDSMSNSFEITRAALSSLTDDLPSIADVESRKRETNRIIVEEVQPALAILSEQVRATRIDQIATTGVGIGVGSLSVLVAWLFGSVEPLLGAAGTMPFLQRLLDKLGEGRKLRRGPLYFLWKVEQSK